MKKPVYIIFSLVIVVMFFAFANADVADTPYGDYCPKCGGKYGVCPSFLTIEESREAVQSYFIEKDINVGQIKGGGRFLKIELIKDDEIYDVILFDRKTGRIRSIY